MVTLAQKYKNQDPTGWMMSEKLDGVRAIWIDGRLLSRQDNPFCPPAWWTAQLPAGITLDGELWIARGQFQRTAGIVRRQSPTDEAWREIRYCVFDAPHVRARTPERLMYIRTALHGSSVAVPVQQHVCADRAHLERFFQSVLSRGGEGVIVRNPAAYYDGCRTANMLKYKPIDTAEAIVIAHDQGAIACKWGKQLIRLGLHGAAHPQIGSRVTFSHMGLTDSGVPRHGTYLAVRDYE